jgi:hypothetical protein
LFIQGHQYTPYYTFDTDEEGVTSNALSQVMDIFYAHKAAVEIAEAPVEAYFMRHDDDAPESGGESHDEDGDKTYFAIIRLSETFPRPAQVSMGPPHEEWPCQDCTSS